MTARRRRVAARVTERFYRADAARSRQRGGSGLGLVIADAVVGDHGGTLSVASRPGEGTTVTLTLPLRSGEDDTTAPADPKDGAGGRAPA